MDPTRRHFWWPALSPSKLNWFCLGVWPCATHPPLAGAWWGEEARPLACGWSGMHVSDSSNRTYRQVCWKFPRRVSLFLGKSCRKRQPLSVPLESWQQVERPELLRQWDEASTQGRAAGGWQETGPGLTITQFGATNLWPRRSET